MINPEFDHEKVASVDWEEAIRCNYRIALFTLAVLLAIPAEA